MQITTLTACVQHGCSRFQLLRDLSKKIYAVLLILYFPYMKKTRDRNQRHRYAYQHHIRTVDMDVIGVIVVIVVDDCVSSM